VVAGVRAAASPVAAVVEVDVDEEEEEEDEVVVERYALGYACKVLAGVPTPLGPIALAGGVSFAVYSGRGAVEQPLPPMVIHSFFPHKVGGGGREGYMGFCVCYLFRCPARFVN
jgi:hypothetical protein